MGEVSRSTEEDSVGFNLGKSNADGEDQLNNIQLIKMAEKYNEELDLDKAVALYDEGIQRFPNDTVILDSYTDLLLQLDSTEKARSLIERSIQLNPNNEGRKYLNYAEMLQNNESL